MKAKIILPIFFLIVLSLSIFISAEEIQITAREYSANTTIHNLGTHTLKLGFDRKLKCDVSAEACLGGSCKTIIPKNIPESLSTEFFFTGAQFDYSLTQGYEYKTTLDCEDEQSTTISKTFTFNVADDAGADNSPPEFTIQPNTIPGNWHNSITHTIYDNGYILLQPFINEFAKCSYSVRSCSPEGSCSGGGGGSSSQPYVMYYDKKVEGLNNEGYEYTITLTCEDLSGNSASDSLTILNGASNDGDEAPSSGGSGGGSNDEDEDGQDESNEEQTSTSTYFKSCSYIWDSSNYVGQNIKISASIKDSTGNSKSDSVEVEVVDGNIGSGGGGHSMSGQNLEIYINSPRGDKVSAGAVEIKISAKGPNKLEDMSLGFSGENWGGGFPISNRNCVSGGSGGGGFGGGSTCEKYYTCDDGTEVQYCEIVKQYDENGNVVGAGCGCKSHPERLCTSSSSGGSGGGSEDPIELPSSGGSGGGGNNATPIICNGCILGDKCVPVGYRTNDKYCNIESEFVSQLEAEENCNNDFECSTNLCIDSQCVSSSLWQKFLRWLSRLFG